MSERDELDQLIDSALSTYAQPRPGVEQRVLARVSGEAARSSRRRWILLATAPVFACLLLFTYLLLKSPHSQRGQVADTPHAEPFPVAHEAVAPGSRPAPPALSGARVRQRIVTPKRIESKAVQRPKLDTFPTPRSLNPEELALIRFGTEAPERDRKALVEAQQQITEPLRISAIHIPPLAPEQDKY